MNHYLAGIEYFQEEYEDKNLIFLAVSDDIAWVQKHLGKIKGTMKIMCTGMNADYANKKVQQIIIYLIQHR